MIMLFHGNIYHFKDSNGEAHLCMYLCDTNIKKMICIVPVDENDHISNTIPITGMKKVLFPERAKEINRSAIIKELKIKGKTVTVDYLVFLTVSEIVLSKLLKKTEQTYKNLSHTRFSNPDKKNYILTEDYYKYLTWFDFKTKLQFEKHINTQPGLLQYGIYWAEIGRNIGSELEKLRPVLLYRKCVSSVDPNQSSYIVIPLTSKGRAARYYTNHPIILDGKTSYVKINDMQRISIKRIVQPYVDSSGNNVVVNKEDIDAIKKIIKKYYVDFH